MEHNEQPGPIGQPALAALNKQIDTFGMLYYLLAGLTGLFSLFPLIHVVVGVWFLISPPTGPNAPPPWFGGVFVVVGLIVITMGMALAATLYFGGRAMRRRSNYTLAMIAAALGCMNMPLGTALGVYTIMTLVKPEVKAEFAS